MEFQLRVPRWVPQEFQMDKDKVETSKTDLVPQARLTLKAWSTQVLKVTLAVSNQLIWVAPSTRVCLPAFIMEAQEALALANLVSTLVKAEQMAQLHRLEVQDSKVDQSHHTQESRSAARRSKLATYLMLPMEWLVCQNNLQILGLLVDKVVSTTWAIKQML